MKDGEGSRLEAELITRGQGKESPKHIRVLNEAQTHHGFNCDDVLRWAEANSYIYRDARKYGTVVGADEVMQLKLIIVAFVKDEERRKKEMREHLENYPGSPSVDGI